MQLGIPRMWTVFFIILCSVQTFSKTAEGKVCTKRAEIGNREGNHYKCDDPVFTDCCERNKTFTCCESHWKISLLQMTWLLVVVVAIIILIFVFVRCLTGQYEHFRSTSIQDAVLNWKFKIVNLFHRLLKPKDGEKHTEVTNSFTNLSLDKEYSSVRLMS